MANNPNDSPITGAPEPIAAPAGPSIPRPVVVSILAVLHFVGGILLFGVQFLMFANLNAMEESLRTIGIPPALLIVAVMFLAALGIASGQHKRRAT